MNKAAQAYFQTNVNTTDQGQLLILLYDGALRFLQQAREKMIEKDYAAKGILISKVIDIINELTNTLNLEKGGTLAENLNNLYFLCITRLLQANLKMDVEQLDNVVSILSGLRSAYAEIIETPEARKASAQIAAKLNVDASIGQRSAIQVHHPVSAPTAMGKMIARNAYGSMQRSAPAMPTAPAGAMPPSAPKSGIAAGMAPAPAVKPVADGQKASELAFTATAQTQPQAPVQNTVPSSAQNSVQNSAPIPTTAAVAPSAPAASVAKPTVPVAPVAAAPANPVAPTATTPAPSSTSTTAAKPAAAKGFGLSGFAYNKAFGK